MEQMRLGHEYSAKLTDIYLHARKRYREAREACSADLRALELSATELVTEIAAADKTRRRELRDALAQVRVALKTTKRDLSTHPALIAAAAEIETEKREAIRKARAECGVYFGTYLRIEAACAQAAAGKMDPVAVGDWDGHTGEIAIWVQHGVSTADIMQRRNRHLQISRPDSRGHCKMFIRIGTDAERLPIWAEFKLVLHRPLPDGIVKWAWARCFRDGGRYVWRLGLSIEAERFVPPKPTQPHASCVIALAWGKLPDGRLTIGELHGSNGTRETLVLPEQMRRRRKAHRHLPERAPQSRLAHAAGLFRVIDSDFEIAKAQLVSFRDSRELPRWLRTDLDMLPSWENKQRLATVVEVWRDRRFDGDDVIYPAMEQWRQRWKHLSQWANAERHRALAYRDEQYRLMALRIARAYREIVIEDKDLRALMRGPEATTSRVIALGRWRAALELAASNTGATIAKIASGSAEDAAIVAAE
jgi:hypothetical protein